MPFWDKSWNSSLKPQNAYFYDLMVIPREIIHFDTINFCTLLNIPIHEFKDRLQKASDYSKFKESVFLRQIEPESAAVIQVKLYKYRGVFLRSMTMRELRI